MGRRIKVLLAIILLITVVFSASVAFKTYAKRASRVSHDSLYSDHGYVDYAKEVYLNVEKYPDTAELGLFWTRWNETKQKIELIPADSEEGAALVDPDKPSIIFVHGMLDDGHYYQDKFTLNSSVAIPEQFGLTGDDVPMARIWQNKGWNVAIYHYNRFASEQSNPLRIEAKIWSIDHPVANMRYRHEDGTYAEFVSEYCMAEHFAAEYIRAMNMLPDSIGDHEIRVASHSMGGQLSTAALFLLTELSDDGQIISKKLPDRFTLLDAYFSTNMYNKNGDLVSMGPKDITVRWSGKPLPYNNTGYTMYECIKALAARDIAVEYYVFDESFLFHAFMPADLAMALNQHCVITEVIPNWSMMNSEYSKTFDGHNGVKDWYLCSFYCDPVKDTEGNIAPSASAPTEVIKNLKGRYYILVQGSGTVLASDDIFELRPLPKDIDELPDTALLKQIALQG